MKVVLAFLFAVFLCFNRCKASGNDTLSKSAIVKRALEEFRDEIIRKNRDDNYHVYVIHFYHKIKDESDFSFTISYIMNSSDFKELGADYYFTYNDMGVLIKNTDTGFLGALDDLGVRNSRNTFCDREFIKILQRLMPTESGCYLTYHPYCLTVEYSNGNYKSRFYKDASKVPHEFSIYADDKREYNWERIR